MLLNWKSDSLWGPETVKNYLKILKSNKSMGHKAKNTASIFKQEKARGSLRAHGLFTSVGRADRISDCEDFN